MYFQRLKDVRDDKDLSQAEVAGLLNIRQTVYSRYERGAHDPSPCSTCSNWRISTTPLPITYWGAPTSRSHTRKNKAAGGEPLASLLQLCYNKGRLSRSGSESERKEGPVGPQRIWRRFHLKKWSR